MANIVTKPVGFLILAIYLILVGVIGIVAEVGSHILSLGLLASVLALVAGVLILLGK